MAFAFGWTPCIGPILGSILVLAATEENIIKGILLLFFYSFGLAIPFILSGNSKKLSIEKAEFLLSEVGLEKRLKSYPNQLSGGEQQRVAIARSLINDPKIILADEPTGNLDNDSSIKVMNIFNNLVSKYGCSIIIATHDLEIANLQDKVISIEELNS